MKYVVIYLKVQNTKSGELKFEGPIIGPVVETELDAESEARKISASMPRFAVMPKIYKFKNSVDDVIYEANKHFNILKRNILESKEIMDRPIKKKK